MNIEKGMKCRQIKSVKLGTIEFNYPEKEFEIVDCNDVIVTCKCGFLNFGISTPDFENYFEIIKPKVLNNDDYRVIVNQPAVIVILQDGTKGVAKCMPDDKFDINKGIEIAYKRAKIKSMTKELKQLTK